MPLKIIVTDKRVILFIIGKIVTLDRSKIVSVFTDSFQVVSGAVIRILKDEEQQVYSPDNNFYEKNLSDNDYFQTYYMMFYDGEKIRYKLENLT